MEWIPSVRRWALSAQTAACLSLAVAAGAQGQVPPALPPPGQVRDSVTHRAVAGALVSVLGTRIAVLADGEGRFQLPSLPILDTPHRLRVERIGYASRTVGLERTDSTGSLVVDLSPQAVSVEGLTIVVDDLRERFERRRNAARGVVHAYDAPDLLALGAENGFGLFWKLVRLSRPCLWGGTDYCVIRGGRDVPVRVCIDERVAWGGVLQLSEYRPDEFWLLEVYDRGRVIRAYTVAWVRRYGMRGALRPLDWGC